MRKPKKVELSLQERAELERWSGDETLPAKQRLRADVLLMADEGMDDTAIAASQGITRQTCGRIRTRFLEEGLQAMVRDRPRSGRRKRIDPQKILTLTTYWPPAPAMDWSRALMAEAAGVSASTVGRVWRRKGIKPHWFASFKVIDDPRWPEKLEAVVGLYLAPLQRTLVLCVDEKIQIQALARTQPSQPLSKGRRRTETHDYTRQAATSMLAALNTLDATVMRDCQIQSRHQEWLRFLQQIDRQTPDHRRLCIVMNDLATDRPENVYGWLDNHPRIRMQITTESTLWLNIVGRFFRVLTTRQLRDGVIQSVPQLHAAITEYIETPKAAPKPFSWTAKVADLRAKDAAR